MEKGNKKFHLIDQYFGIPIVFLLGLFRIKKTKRPVDISRIAVVNIGSIGDNVLMSAVIHDLRSKYPDATIDVLTGSTNYDIVKLIDGINTVIKLPITNPVKTVGILKSLAKYDVAFDFGPWPRLNAIYANFVPAKYKVGFKTHGHHRHYVYDERVEHLDTVHEIDNHRALIKGFYDGEHHIPAIKYTPTPKTEKAISQYGKYCIIHGWSGGLMSSLKQWDNQNWVELIYKISADFDNILLTGAPSDKEKTQELFNLIDKSKLKGKVLDVAGQFNINETMHLINASACVICVDTGIAHMAAALNKKLICLQGPASSLRWRPYNDENTIVVNPDRGTFGYLSLGFEFEKAVGSCMDDIQVDRVYNLYTQFNK